MRAYIEKHNKRVQRKRKVKAVTNTAMSRVAKLDNLVVLSLVGAIIIFALVMVMPRAINSWYSQQYEQPAKYYQTIDTIQSQNK